jgi:hypothetical protein
MHGFFKNIGAHEFKIIHVIRKFQNLDLGYLELCDECSNFVNNIYPHFVKIIWTQPAQF